MNNFIVVVLILTILLGVTIAFNNRPSEKFDSVLWKAQWNQFSLNINNPDYDASDAYALLSERSSMIKFLLDTEILINLDKSAVIDILGLEDNDLELDTWDYWIGRRGIGESRFLRIKFDTNDKVNSVEKFNEA